MIINFELTNLLKKDLPTVKHWVQESLNRIESTKSKIQSSSLKIIILKIKKIF